MIGGIGIRGDFDEAEARCESRFCRKLNMPGSSSTISTEFRRLVVVASWSVRRCHRNRRSEIFSGTNHGCRVLCNSYRVVTSVFPHLGK